MQQTSNKQPMETINQHLQAAEQGELVAMLRMSHCYFYGDGVHKDELAAVAWLRRAADEGWCYALT